MFDILSYLYMEMLEIVQQTVFTWNCGENLCNGVQFTWFWGSAIFSKQVVYSCLIFFVQQTEDQTKKKRTFRKFTFRGVDLDQLLDMSM